MPHSGVFHVYLAKFSDGWAIWEVYGVGLNLSLSSPLLLCHFLKILIKLTAG